MDDQDQRLPGRVSHDGLRHDPQVLAETRFLQLIQDRHWTYTKRPSNISAMAIVAVTAENELLLVDQYRIPVQGRVIELPAGLVGDTPAAESETVEEAARRELIEEVGYSAERIKRLTHAVSSAGLTDESIHLVQALGLKQVAAGGGDESEDIQVCRVPVAHVADWLADRQQAGWSIDFKVYAGLWYLREEATSKLH